MIDFDALIDSHFGFNPIEHAVYFFKDSHLRYQYVSPTFLSLLSYYFNRPVKAKEILNKTDKDIYPQESAEFFTDFDRRVRDSQTEIKEYESFKINKTQRIFAVARKKTIYYQNTYVGILGKTKYLNIFTINGKMVILSQRELDVLVHIVFGLSIKVIAKHLSISAGSVSTYIMRIKTKLMVDTQLELIALIKEHVLANYAIEYLNKRLGNDNEAAVVFNELMAS